MEHPVWFLPVDNAKGQLVLTPCPGTKGVSLDASLQQLKQQGVKAIVTALSQAELESKGVGLLGEKAQELDIKWFSLPIDDDAVPDEHFATQWQAISSQLHQIIENQDNVMLHCMGGSGRTGLLAAHLLLEYGWNIDTIIEQVQALRPNAFTHADQQHYVQQLANVKQ